MIKLLCIISITLHCPYYSDNSLEGNIWYCSYVSKILRFYYSLDIYLLYPYNDPSHKANHLSFTMNSNCWSWVKSSIIYHDCLCTYNNCWSPITLSSLALHLPLICCMHSIQHPCFITTDPSLFPNVLHSSFLLGPFLFSNIQRQSVPLSHNFL